MYDLFNENSTGLEVYSATKQGGWRYGEIWARVNTPMRYEYSLDKTDFLLLVSIW